MRMCYSAFRQTGLFYKSPEGQSEQRNRNTERETEQLVCKRIIANTYVHINIHILPIKLI